MDRNLRAFLAVARAGNLTSAAGEIGLTQPALTKTVRRLELDFGARLFTRTKRGMVLTHVGETLFQRAEAIEMHYRQAHEEIKAATAGSVPHFRIAAGAAYHMTAAPSLAKQLMIEFPDTRFTLDFDVAGTTLPKLIDGTIDLMLGALHIIPPEGIEVREILDVEMAVYCCRSNPLAASGVLPPQALRDRRWIIYKRDQLIAERLESYCARYGLTRPKVVMEVDSLISSFSIVKDSEFLTMAPTSLTAVAETAGLARLTMAAPLWNFTSGAWFRQSWKNMPIMQRALALLPAITGSPTRGLPTTGTPTTGSPTAEPVASENIPRGNGKT